MSNYIGWEKMRKIFMMLGSVIFMAILVWANSLIILKVTRVKPVSEWSDVFDIDCSCGQHLHGEPYDKDHYKFVCINCDKVYEKDWDIARSIGGTFYEDSKEVYLDGKK